MLLMAELTKTGKRILETIRTHDGWINRSDIAEKLGKTRLNSSDINQLEGLVDMGLVDRDSEVVGIVTQYLYRSTS